MQCMEHLQKPCDKKTVKRNACVRPSAIWCGREDVVKVMKDYGKPSSHHTAPSPNRALRVYHLQKRARDSALGDSTVMGSHDGLDGFQRMMKTKFKTKVRDASGM